MRVSSPCPIGAAVETPGIEQAGERISVPQDDAKAHELYEKAAARGDARAKTALEQLSAGQHTPSAQPPNQKLPGARTHVHGVR
jgi:TPR repeat protein